MVKFLKLFLIKHSQDFSRLWSQWMQGHIFLPLILALQDGTRHRAGTPFHWVRKWEAVRWFFWVGQRLSEIFWLYCVEIKALLSGWWINPKRWLVWSYLGFSGANRIDMVLVHRNLEYDTWAWPWSHLSQSPGSNRSFPIADRFYSLLSVRQCHHHQQVDIHDILSWVACKSLPCGTTSRTV